MEGLHFVPALPDVETALKRSKWITRAWTLQEAVLSRRCLVFTGDQLYYRCKDVNAETTKSVEVHPAKPRSRLRAFEHLFNPEYVKNISISRTFAEYVLMVQGYLARALSYESDIIKAFAGIMSTMGLHFRGTGFFCGLPQSVFDRAILWYPVSPATCRNAKMASIEGPAWPSWTWAGWVGGVDYESDHLNLKDIESLVSAIF